MKTLLLLSNFILTFSFVFSQKINYFYRGLSSDTSYNEHLLKLNSDTTFQVMTFPRHMSKGFWITINYKRSKNELETTSNNFSYNDSLALLNHKFGQYLNRTKLVRSKNFLIDEEHKILYVSNKKFLKKYYLTYIIDGKKYKQETSSANAYGLIKSKLKVNKELNNKIDSLKNKLDNYSITVYKGLDAYRLFGSKYIFGVIVIKQKE